MLSIPRQWERKMNRLVSALVLKVASDKVRQIKSVRSISKDFFIYHVTLSRYCKKLAKPQRTRFKKAASVYSTIINSTIIKCDSVGEVFRGGVDWLLD